MGRNSDFWLVSWSVDNRPCSLKLPRRCVVQSFPSQKTQVCGSKESTASLPVNYVYFHSSPNSKAQVHLEKKWRNKVFRSEAEHFNFDLQALTPLSAKNTVKRLERFKGLLNV